MKRLLRAAFPAVMPTAFPLVITRLTAGFGCADFTVDHLFR